jgi:hypothetical protein
LGQAQVHSAFAAQKRAFNHQFSVRANDEHRDAAGIRGNYCRSFRIARPIEFNAAEVPVKSRGSPDVLPFI